MSQINTVTFPSYFVIIFILIVIPIRVGLFFAFFCGEKGVSHQGHQVNPNTKIQQNYEFVR